MKRIKFTEKNFITSIVLAIVLSFTSVSLIECTPSNKKDNRKVKIITSNKIKILESRYYYTQHIEVIQGETFIITDIFKGDVLFQVIKADIKIGFETSKIASKEYAEEIIQMAIETDNILKNNK